MAVAAVAAVAAGVGAGIAASSLAVGMAVGAAVFSAAMAMNAPKAAGVARSNTERKQVVRSSKSPLTYVVGKTVSSGVLFFAEEQPGGQDFDDDEALYLALAIAGHPLDDIGQIWLDDTPITDFGGRAEYEIHNGRTTADPYLLARAPSWENDMIGEGIAWVRFTLRYDQDTYPSGIPTPRFEKYGVPCYDPRDEGTRWTENAALIILWYYRTMCGVPDDEILWDSFIEAANLCDETVTTPDDTEEPRYIISGEFDADERRDRVLEDMHAACAGEPLRIGGRIGLLVGAYYGPNTFTITESMIVGDVSIQPEVERSEATNAIYGTFADPEQRYSETDYPPVRVQEWIDEDGEEIKDDLDLRFVPSPYQAQRIANIRLRRKRSGARLDLTMNLTGYAVRPGMVVGLDLPLIGMEGEFRVTSWNFHGDSGAKISLAQEGPEIYDDAIGKPYTSPDLIGLPTGGPGSPTGLQFVIDSVGDIVQGTLVWQVIGAPAYHNVIVRRGSNVITTAQVPGSRLNLSGLTAGEYTAEVRAVDGFGVRSGAATLAFSIAKPPMPETVETELGNWFVTLRPRVFSSTTDAAWEFWFSPDDLDASDVEANAQFLTRGASLEHQGLQAGTTYYYWVRGINAYGKSAFFRVEVKTTADSSEVINLISGQINESMLTKQFQEYIEGLGNQWTVRVDQDGRVAGIGLYNDGSAADFIVVADRFWVADPDNVAGDTKPFMVVDGNTYINTAFIREVTIDKLRSADGSLVFENERLQAKFIDVENLNVQWANIQNVSIKNSDIQNAAINNAKIADAAITDAKIQNGAITSAKIQNAAINSAKIADAAITDAKIDFLDAGKIKTGHFSADRIKAGTIEADKLVLSSWYAREEEPSILKKRRELRSLSTGTWYETGTVTTGQRQVKLRMTVQTLGTGSTSNGAEMRMRVGNTEYSFTAVINEMYEHIFDVSPNTTYTCYTRADGTITTHIAEVYLQSISENFS